MGAVAAILAGASAATSVIQGYQQAQAMRLQGQYQKQLYDFNARISKISAENALFRGEEAAKKVKKQADIIVGAQRANYAAQGIDVNLGSAVEVQADTMAQAAADAVVIRNNAWREAWGYRVQGMQATFAGRFAEAGANFNANQTIIGGYTGALTGAANAISYGGGRTPGSGGGPVAPGGGLPTGGRAPGANFPTAEP